MFEFAGSAFYDSLFTNKGIVMLDTKIRKWFDPSKDVLKDRCNIIDTYIDKKNWIRFKISNYNEALNKAISFIIQEKKISYLYGR